MMQIAPNHDLRKAVEESLYEASHAFGLAVAAYPNPPKHLLAEIRDGTFIEVLMSNMLQELGQEWAKALIAESRRAHETEGGIASEFILKQGQVITLLLDQKILMNFKTTCATHLANG